MNGGFIRMDGLETPYIKSFVGSTHLFILIRKLNIIQLPSIYACLIFVFIKMYFVLLALCMLARNSS
jgi:hypothetical protein